MQPSFDSLLVVVAIAFVAPFVLGLFPSVRLPSPVLEIVLGIVVGPSVLAIAHADTTVNVMATIGLAFLLFLAGIEIEFGKLRGQVLRLTLAGFGLSFVIAVVAGFVLKGAGVVQTPLLVAIGSLFGIAAAVYVFVRRAERSKAVMGALVRLQDTTAQIRVRASVVLLIGFAALAEQLGLEAILGAFAAGAVLTLVDQDRAMTHPLFRTKLEAIGFGFFVPVFFVTTGLKFDLNALLDHPSNLVKVPVFLAALLLVRGLPAFVYRRVIGTERSVVAGVLQATSLPFIVAATTIGVDKGLL